MDPKRSLIAGESPNLQEKKDQFQLRKQNIPDQPFISTSCRVITICFSQGLTFHSPLTDSSRVEGTFPWQTGQDSVCYRQGIALLMASDQSSRTGPRGSDSWLFAQTVGLKEKPGADGSPRG